ncbi:LON peptidase substrate-binding domain-containing protein [Pseudomonas sp. RTC3]|uniref:LON peptidase substrate-binding domain-containing protein n=1 Tax=unclassified Pseudomonas TaxID=196821 RepID=UPI002AB3D582|nr:MULTISPECIES: LON peptidase substrate-binding domain-containing protein [unclassified Pseudomonas]MEB0061596.1 LON peptidase substrate-binding domain-containing protein [Pseudomonas sp. RTC3]MDY7566629.1 LON peptidase substrate-binding domain-containing protein [Pseudomonas sp. 5C2]MEB0005750.1 LON peptidase substrate-binding domain-containing protein [Pseudomonas sp. RTB2]MEB0016905.1 LON peptidase substrate-binding domain-containing protein [Pseudomonas sp. RTB3]MEB0024997.1 LON peptidase
MVLPLFPLNAVLFPGCMLDLQLFEARYLDMVSRGMKQGEGFGVVCILDGEEVGQAPEGYALVGCEALVRDFQQQDNGLLGIRVEGGRRFRVVSTQVQRDQLIMADVEWLDELPERPLQEADADLVALLAALAEHPMVAALNMGVTASGQQSLANQLAYLLPFTEEDKVELLELNDAQERLDAIQDLLDEIQGDVQA